MYQWSRALWRDLVPLVRRGAAPSRDAERRLLRACEAAVMGLGDAAHPVHGTDRALFRAIRHLLRPDDQLAAHRIIAAHTAALRRAARRRPPARPSAAGVRRHGTTAVRDQRTG